jgi:hypothetical protein
MAGPASGGRRLSADRAPAVSNDNFDVSTVAEPVRARPNAVDLPSLLVDLLAAKDVVAHDLTPGRNHEPSPARGKLLACMEAYVAALTARRLPIPPRLRDDLRLHRSLYPWATHQAARRR